MSDELAKIIVLLLVGCLLGGGLLMLIGFAWQGVLVLRGQASWAWSVPPVCALFGWARNLGIVGLIGVTAFAAFGQYSDGWVLLGLMGMGLVVGLILRARTLRRHRRRDHLCLKCGYDLRGSEDICPECGTEFEAT